MMPNGNDLLMGAVLGSVLLGLVAAAELWRWLANPQPECTRKLVHVSGGLVCVFFPFLIESHWVVLAVMGSMAAIFLVSHRGGLLKSLHGVDRQSGGAVYYTLAIYLLFLLTADQPCIYVICSLVLALSDALAAVIGKSYGRLRYQVHSERKSLEGSLAFLVITFLIVQLLLVLWPDSSMPDTPNLVAAAFLVAIFATGLEAASIRGIDNLSIPLGTEFLLTKVLWLPLPEIAVQLANFTVIGLMIGCVFYRLRVFDTGKLIILILCTYASWSLGAFHFSIPVLLGFAMYLARSRARSGRTLGNDPLSQLEQRVQFLDEDNPSQGIVQ